jgi:hypothetical protein
MVMMIVWSWYDDGHGMIVWSWYHGGHDHQDDHHVDSYMQTYNYYDYYNYYYYYSQQHNCILSIYLSIHSIYLFIVSIVHLDYSILLPFLKYSTVCCIVLFYTSVLYCVFSNLDTRLLKGF